MSSEGKESQLTEALEGRSANSFRIGYNAYEFYLDFGQIPLHGEETQFHTRIIAAPVYAKAFLKLCAPP